MPAIKRAIPSIFLIIADGAFAASWLPIITAGIEPRTSNSRSSKLVWPSNR